MLIDEVKDKEYLAKGKRGVVYTGYLDEKKVAIKKKNPDSQAHNRMKIEADFLKKLNMHSIGPHFLESGEGYLMYGFVEGVPIVDFMKQSCREDLMQVLIAILKQLYRMDTLGINKEEMTHPVKHILVKEGNDPVMIDFERCNHTIKPKNVTQFCQFITSSNIAPILKEKGIFLEKEELMKKAGLYKKDISEERFSRIMELIKSSAV